MKTKIKHLRKLYFLLPQGQVEVDWPLYMPIPREGETVNVEKHTGTVEAVKYSVFPTYTGVTIIVRP